MEPGKNRTKKFRTIHGVRSYVSRVLRALEDSGNAADPLVARTMIYGAKVMAELIDRGQLEERIRALEERTNATSEAKPNAMQ